MGPLLLLKALVLGIVEGLTEFLPISSTGHLILAADLLGFNDAKGKVFQVFIQTGAMLAVVWEYRARFVQLLRGLAGSAIEQRLVTNLAIAFLPAAVLGAAFGSSIKTYLFRPIPVAAALLAVTSVRSSVRLAPRLKRPPPIAAEFPTTSTVSIAANKPFWALVDFSERALSSENFTSSALKSVPSWNFTPVCSLNV